MTNSLHATTLVTRRMALPTLYTTATFGHAWSRRTNPVLQRLSLVTRWGMTNLYTANYCWSDAQDGVTNSLYRSDYFWSHAGWRYQLFILQRLLCHAWSRRYQLFILQLLLLVTRRMALPTLYAEATTFGHTQSACQLSIQQRLLLVTWLCDQLYSD